MADQLVVMNQGRIEEVADADEIYSAPKIQLYQRHLIAASSYRYSKRFPFCQLLY